MTAITLDELQQNLSGFLSRVRAGEAFLILQAETPIAEVKPIAPPLQGLRPFGLCKGEFVVPDDFDAPLQEEVLCGFERT